MNQHLRPLIFPVLLVIYEIALYLSNDMYLPALPDMMKTLHLSPKQAQLTLTMWFLGSSAMPLVIGVLSDRFGRRPALLGGGIIYILATVVCALATNLYTLLIARTLQGGMVPTMLVPGYACIHETFDQKQAIRILALMGSISILAPGFGPFVGSLVLYFGSWRIIFWIIAIVAAVSVASLYRWMPETVSLEQRQPLYFNKLLLSYARVITNRKFMFLMFALGFNFGGFIAWISAGPLLVIESFYYSAIVFGLIQVAVFAPNIFGNRLVKYLLDYFSVDNLIRLGVYVTLFGGLSMPVLSFLFPSWLSAFVIGMMIYSFGSALWFSSLNRKIIESSEEAMGIRMAMFIVFLNVFAVLGSGSASVFFNGTTLSLALVIAIAMICACIMLSFVLNLFSWRQNVAG